MTTDSVTSLHPVYSAFAYIDFSLLAFVYLPVQVGGVASWWRGTVVERRSLAGELSLSCARPAADG